MSPGYIVTDSEKIPMTLNPGTQTINLLLFSDPIRLARMVSRGFKLIGLERYSDPIRLVRMVKKALPPNLIHHPNKVGWGLQMAA